MSIHALAHRTRMAVEAQSASHRQKPAAFAIWLRIFLVGLAEGYTAYARYCRHVEQGVAPDKAIRAAFELDQHIT